MVQDKAILTMANQYNVICDLSIGAIFNDLDRPLTQISMSRQYLALNMALTDHILAYNGEQIRTYTRPTHQYNFERP